MREQFKEGREVQKVCVYGPADTDFDGRYWGMEIVLECGEQSYMPWVRAFNRKTGEVVMINCAKCACIEFAPTGDER